MSDVSQGDGWWLASDGKWYPPQAGNAQPPSPPPTSPQAPTPPPAPGAPPPPVPPGPVGPPSGSDDGAKWYEAVALIVLALICCAPLGLVLTWLNRRWSTKTKWTITAVIVVVMILAIVAAAVAPKKKSTDSINASVTATTAKPAETTTTAAAVTTTTAAPTTTVAPTTTAPPAPVGPAVIFEKSGSGIGTTPNFTVPSEWQIDYTFDCSNFGGQGNFIISVNGVGKNGSNMDFDAPSVNQLAASGADSAYAHSDPGVKNIEVNSECNWTVKVVG